MYVCMRWWYFLMWMSLTSFLEHQSPDTSIWNYALQKSKISHCKLDTFYFIISCLNTTGYRLCTPFHNIHTDNKLHTLILSQAVAYDWSLEYTITRYWHTTLFLFSVTNVVLFPYMGSERRWPCWIKPHYISVLSDCPWSTQTAREEPNKTDPRMGHITWWTFLELSPWYPIMLSSLCNSFEDRGTRRFHLRVLRSSNELQ